MAAIDELRRHAQELTASTRLEVDLIEEGNRIFVVIRAVPLPEGLFRAATTDVLFITDQQYPFSAVDMFWTEIEVLRPDGSPPQNADVIEQYLGRSWRRFSWHRNNVWKPGGNPLLDHFAFMESRWAAERR